MTMPPFDPGLAAMLNELYQDALPVRQGEVSDMLPELRQADPDAFAVCAVTADGARFAVGDAEAGFPILSVSKPFVFGLALTDHGPEQVRQRIGVEPTGDAFNSIIQHEQLSEGRFNPMVNAGAVTTTSLIRGAGLDQRTARLAAMFASFAGRPLAFDDGVMASRRKLNSLNRAIAYFMESEGRLAGDVEETIELYTHQCALRVTCADLAAMAATLANAGVNPLTGERAIAADHVRNVLSVMFTSGLYEFSGQWAYRVGLAAKSGLAGSIIAVVPGVMGLAVYSPRLGEHHKSERGVRVLEGFSRRAHHHLFSRPGPEAAAARAEVGAGELSGLLAQIHRRYRDLDEGAIYISEPGLYHVDADQFGICAVTVDGAIHEAGDSRVDFLIQSVSKVFTYGLALEDHGRDVVHRRVDVEPTGDAYNAVIKVETRSKRSHNPMVNTGGIATTSLVKGGGPAKRLNRILAMYQRYIGRRVFIDTPVFISEQAASDRNWAISYLLRNFGMIEGDIKETLDLYLQQCSAIINCRDLAMMGAALANDGVNPVTGERAIRPEYVQDLLTVMYTCGMYDYAGEWAYNVGLPAKSGVSGCILGVVPGRMGIAVFSRPLDRRGNSVRGIKVFEELSRRLGLHVFQPTTGR